MSDVLTLFADHFDNCAVRCPGCSARPVPRVDAQNIQVASCDASSDVQGAASTDDQSAETDQLHAILCRMNLPILHLCPDQRLSYFSEAAKTQFGISEVDLGTKLAFSGPMTAWGTVTEVRKTDNPHREVDAASRAKAWKCRILPHFAHDGSPGGMMVILLAQPVSDPVAAAVADNGLTPRQREVMDMVLAGHASKNIAHDLKISQRTVENHRAAIMRRTGATSLPALARMAIGSARSADLRAQDLGRTTEVHR